MTNTRIHSELSPAPVGADGAPLSCEPLWLQPWLGRLAAGLTEEEFWAANPASPVFGDLKDEGGTLMREVTFLWEGTEAEVMVHINSLTDAHRDDLDPAMLHRVPGTSIHHLSYLLPEDLVAAYRIVASGGIPRDAGQTRPGWKRIHELGRPDPRNPRTLPHPLGETSSVLAMPGFTPHPAWEGVVSGLMPVSRGWVTHVFTVPVVSVPRTIHLYAPAEAVRGLLVLFDGDQWASMDLVTALDAYGAQGLAVAMVSSVSPEDRSRDLPESERLGAILRTEVLPALFGALGTRIPPEQVIIAGQSFGGLAAAGVVLEHPDLARTAIVQSGSFHFRSDTELRRDAQEPGDLSERLAARGLVPGARGARILMQVGSEEGVLVEQGRILRDRALDAGFNVSYREVRGGHDFAWWSHGLFEALDELTQPQHWCHCCH